MSRTAITNGQSGLSVRTGLNANFVELYAAIGGVTPEMYGAAGGLSTDDTVAVQSCLDAAYGAGGTAVLPGRYNITSPLLIRSPVLMPQGGLLKATSSMDSVVYLGSSSGVVNNADILGLTIDANDLANRALWVKKATHARLDRLNLANSTSIALDIGDDTITFAGYETLVSDILIERTKGTIASGSIGVRIGTTHTDVMIRGNNIVKDAETGVSAQNGNNVVSGVHAWANPTYGVMLVGFDDNANGNTWSENQADTCANYGFWFRKQATRVLGNTAYNNTAGSDGFTIAYHFTDAAPGAVFIGNRTIGSVSHRFDKDFDLSFALTTVVSGNIYENVVTPNATGFNYTDGSGRSLQWRSNVLAYSSVGDNFLSAINGRLRIQVGSYLTIETLGNYANDAAAATGGVAVNGLYRNGSAVQVRVV